MRTVTIHKEYNDAYYIKLDDLWYTGDPLRGDAVCGTAVCRPLAMRIRTAKKAVKIAEKLNKRWALNQVARLNNGESI